MRLLRKLAWPAYTVFSLLVAVAFLAGPPALYAGLYKSLGQQGPPHAWWRWFISPPLLLAVEGLTLLGNASSVLSEFRRHGMRAVCGTFAVIIAVIAACCAALTVLFRIFQHYAPVLGAADAACAVWGVAYLALAAFFIARHIVLRRIDARLTDETMPLDVDLPPDQRTAEGALPFARNVVVQWCRSHQLGDDIVLMGFGSFPAWVPLDALLAGRYTVGYRLRLRTRGRGPRRYRVFRVKADLALGRLTELAVEWGYRRWFHAELPAGIDGCVSLHRALELAGAYAEGAGVRFTPQAEAGVSTSGDLAYDRGVAWDVFYGGLEGRPDRPTYQVFVTADGRAQER